MAESITITDNRTGESHRDPDRRRRGIGRRVVASSCPASGSTTRASCRRRRARARSPTSTATTASSATAATRSSSWPSTRPTSRWPTCCSTASCRRPAQFDDWQHEITYHTFIHENVRKRFLEGFHYDAHPMGMLVSAVAALSTFYLDAKDIFDPESAAQADHPADRQDADAGRGRPPLQRGHAVRLPGQLARLRRRTSCR